MNNKKRIYFLVLLLILFFSINYQGLDNLISEFFEDFDIFHVERIIDGDTIVVNKGFNNTNIRLLGINTPEKGEDLYKESKDFLDNLITNKTIKAEYGNEKYDKYKRTLAYVFLDDKNINVEIVKNGFANLYVYGYDKYYEELKDAWEKCLISEKNICEKSKDICSNCIELKEINLEEQKIIFYNKCSFQCNISKWELKDEGRKKFIFENNYINPNMEIKIVLGNKTNTNNILYWNQKDYVWTKTGDTLFLRDNKNKLVLWRYINRK